MTDRRVAQKRDIDCERVGGAICDETLMVKSTHRRLAANGGMVVHSVLLKFSKQQGNGRSVAVAS